jgi:carbamoyl-phosphate synthase large subunit
MKSVGEAMAIGRTFKEALQKALRSLETGRAAGVTTAAGGDELRDEELHRQRLATPNARPRCWPLGLQPG